jgi:hypothetical protein
MQQQILNLLNTRPAKLALGLLALGLAYGLTLRAIDTGSLQQYFLVIVLLVTGITLLIGAVKRS